ncbi:MAG: DNA repair protein RadA [Bacteroides sp.]
MTKVKSSYVCQNCGASSVKWLGRCPACGQWNTYVEEKVVLPTQNTKGLIEISRQAHPQNLREVRSSNEVRLDSGLQEVNRLLGGGIVPGSIILLGGEPGIGKSTLSLQIALRSHFEKILYVSGEESASQIRMRADRLGVLPQNCMILNETLLENILLQCKEISPGLVVIDSIQTLYSENMDSSAGSIAQVRECAAALLRYAKTSGIPVLLIGHINKEGTLAGPKVLEHIVDVVLQFEGDSSHTYRLLRSIKNRFGSTYELAMFEMQDVGLREITDPSELLLTHRQEGLSGIAVTVILNGIRPLLVEVQALVSNSAYGTPQRSTTGYDPRRLNMLLAVLERRLNLRMATRDVFLNIAGGIKVEDPGVDLGVLVAILSSLYDVAIPMDWCFAGEVGLAGEIRPVARMDQRTREAHRLGFKILNGARLPVETQASFPTSGYRGIAKVDELSRILLKQ